MPKLKRLSGRQIVAIFENLGFQVVSQRGSHAKLRRVSGTGVKETLTIPMHDEMDVGTLRAIVRQASRFVSEDVLKERFYG